MGALGTGPGRDSSPRSSIHSAATLHFQRPKDLTSRVRFDPLTPPVPPPTLITTQRS